MEPPKRNSSIRIIRIVTKGFIELTFTILIHTREHRSHYHHRKLRIFSPNITDEKRNDKAA